uniref:Uncharacterized protein n=1 Tax=viral metagenome TaxID=1070528 RepID=A0A6C0CD63_9ZZZZ
MSCNCVNCDCSIQLCKYKCENSGYNIYDQNNTFIKKEYDCDIESTDPEINTESNIEYCSMCNVNIEYPDSYDNTNQVFTNNGENIYYYENFLKRNIIHNFTNIQCGNCSCIMNNGYFTIEVVEETEDNLNNLSMPNDFIKNIMVYDNSDNLVYSIEPSDYDEYKELIEFNTDISKKILYCSNCNYIILNNLKKIQRFA